MMSSKLVPELRFKEFSGEWEEKKLKNIAKITTGNSNREDSTENKGQYTFFDRSEDIRTSHRYLFDDEAIIVAGEGQKFIPKYYKGKFDLHQRTYAILQLQIIGKFLYYYTDKYKDYFLQNAVGSTVKSLRLPMFQQMPILLPTLPEQQKIANTFSSLDNLIETQTKKVELLKSHKKGLMQKLFPRYGAKVPEVRFKEFSGEWKNYQLRDITSYFKGFAFKSKDYTSNGKRIVRVSDMGFDYIKKTDKAIYLKEEDAKQYTRWKLQKDDLIITTVGSKPPMYDSLVGRTIVVKYKDKSSLLNQNAVCLRANKNINQHFLNTLFKRNEYITFIESIIRGNANQGSIALENLFKYRVFIPTPQEQQKIADTLSSLDNLIEAQTKKIELLKEHKKGLMQKMFVGDK